MNKFFKNPPVLLSSISSFIYLIVSLSICINIKSNVFEYTAALLPFFIVLISSTVSIRFNFIGGLLLFIEGILITYFFLSNFYIGDVIVAILLFGFPVIASGLILILKFILGQRLSHYEFKSVYRFF